MISCLGLWTRTVAQYLLGWASILPTTYYREQETLKKEFNMILCGSLISLLI